MTFSLNAAQKLHQANSLVEFFLEEGKQEALREETLSSDSSDGKRTPEMKDTSSESGSVSPSMEGRFKKKQDRSPAEELILKKTSEILQYTQDLTSGDIQKLMQLEQRVNQISPETADKICELCINLLLAEEQSTRKSYKVFYRVLEQVTPQMALHLLSIAQRFPDKEQKICQFCLQVLMNEGVNEDDVEPVHHLPSHIQAIANIYEYSEKIKIIMSIACLNPSDRSLALSRISKALYEGNLRITSALLKEPLAFLFESREDKAMQKRSYAYLEAGLSSKDPACALSFANLILTQKSGLGLTEDNPLYIKALAVMSSGIDNAPFLQSQSTSPIPNEPIFTSSQRRAVSISETIGILKQSATIDQALASFERINPKPTYTQAIDFAANLLDKEDALSLHDIPMLFELEKILQKSDPYAAKQMAQLCERLVVKQEKEILVMEEYLMPSRFFQLQLIAEAYPEQVDKLLALYLYQLVKDVKPKYQLQQIQVTLNRTNSLKEKIMLITSIACLDPLDRTVALSSMTDVFLKKNNQAIRNLFNDPLAYVFSYVDPNNFDNNTGPEIKKGAIAYLTKQIRKAPSSESRLIANLVIIRQKELGLSSNSPLLKQAKDILASP